MSTEKIYFTLLVYLKKGQREMFHSFEHKVLPLLPAYNGTLELRIQTDKKEDDTEVPDEIHIISFFKMEDFEHYRNDGERKRHIEMFHQSVDKAMLIKGRDIRLHK
jgi:antibiotic biosynthesis monooxygenase (ABM) superfamily enzyme